jgi:hypothetical protein
MKEAYPVQSAEYAVQARLVEEPAFAWWAPHTSKKRNCIIAKVKSKYWLRTHEFGIQIPKSVQEAREIDAKNGNTYWWDAILKEMKNVRPVWEASKDKIPPGYQQIKCHLIFDVKMGENFRRKARFVAGGHTTEVPELVIIYLSVVLRDSVRIALTIAGLNGSTVEKNMGGRGSRVWIGGRKGIHHQECTERSEVRGWRFARYLRIHQWLQATSLVKLIRTYGFVLQLHPTGLSTTRWYFVTSTTYCQSLTTQS